MDPWKQINQVVMTWLYSYTRISYYSDVQLCLLEIKYLLFAIGKNIREYNRMNSWNIRQN